MPSINALLKINIGNTPLDSEIMSTIMEVTVDQDVALPESCAIRINDGSARAKGPSLPIPVFGAKGALSKSFFQLGKDLEVEVTGLIPVKLFRGEITSIEADVRDDGAITVIVRAADRAHKMHRTRKTETFVDVKDADLVTKIARKHGLIPSANVPGPIYTHVYQDNQTDWEFLRGRANDIGCELVVRGKELILRKPTGAGSKPKHRLLDTLQRFRVRMSVPSQVSKVIVRGWDETKQLQITGEAKTPNSNLAPVLTPRKTGAAASKQAYQSEATYLITAYHVTSKLSAEKMAQAVLDEIASEFIQVEGTIAGDPNVLAGGKISLEGVGSYSGSYYVSAAVHRFNRTGYTTEFTVSGRHPRSLGTLIAAAGHGGSGPQSHRGFRGIGSRSGRHPGVAIGVVTKLKAEGKEAGKHEGAVKVKFPWLDKSHESQWARLSVPMAGANRGMYMLPEINEEVLVAFEFGDINRPYVIGTLWNSKHKPPLTAAKAVDAKGKVNIRAFVTRAGHKIEFDDTANAEKISIIDKTTNNKIIIDSKNKKIEIKSSDAIEITASGELTLKGKKVTVKATGGEVALTGVGVTVDSGTGTLTTKGKDASITASTGKVSVSGTGGVDVKATGVLNLKGTLVNIN